jgi:hypothetical protein
MSEQLKLPEPKLSKRQKALVDLLLTGRKLSKQEIWEATGIWNVGESDYEAPAQGFLNRHGDGPQG